MVEDLARRVLLAAGRDTCVKALLATLGALLVAAEPVSFLGAWDLPEEHAVVNTHMLLILACPRAVDGLQMVRGG